jgi:hypothetical protein
VLKTFKQQGLLGEPAWGSPSGGLMTLQAGLLQVVLQYRLHACVDGLGFVLRCGVQELTLGRLATEEVRAHHAAEGALVDTDRVGEILGVLVQLHAVQLETHHALEVVRRAILPPHVGECLFVQGVQSDEADVVGGNGRLLVEHACFVRAKLVRLDRLGHLLGGRPQVVVGLQALRRAHVGQAGLAVGRGQRCGGSRGSADRHRAGGRRWRLGHIVRRATRGKNNQQRRKKRSQGRLLVPIGKGRDKPSQILIISLILKMSIVLPQLTSCKLVRFYTKQNSGHGIQ